jgi:hypothetical protein
MPETKGKTILEEMKTVFVKDDDEKNILTRNKVVTIRVWKNEWFRGQRWLVNSSMSLLLYLLFVTYKIILQLHFQPNYS